ncbi:MULTISPECIES: acyl-CoA dehydrogenase family protein [unclassified Pseudoalteromonas]|uniref:acyl-CoA dehydrogenase family protein n=1 Tax=unclassified Pseudoalteromonas TaxID=194690 RepID=UPI003014741B
MTYIPPEGETHEVFNQPPALENYNVFSSDTVLQYWVQRFASERSTAVLEKFGKECGHGLLAAGFLANKHLPELQSHDRFGHRIDQINYHPAYHQLMRHAIEQGHCSLPWQDHGDGSHVMRAAMAYLHTHADPGSGCPLTMTFAAVPAIASQPDIASQWLPKILSGVYDERNIPWFDKQGVTIGMAMTEKQGGSDVRANTTTAQALSESGPGQLYSLSGHKWFCSAPMCDGFLVLAQVERRLSCFLVPRWREDRSKNPIHIQRLKNKLGNRSNASSEIEFRGAHGWLLGEEGRGIATIIQMVALTRYDCMLGSTALMAQAAKEAMWHTAHRQAFGKPLQQQPLMTQVLADLALEAEAAMAISFRLAHALDNQALPHEAALIRSATAIGKYWICKRAVQHTYEAMECIGGVGYVEENITARTFREAPVNAIWEGSGNVQCLDLLRVLQREPDTLAALFSELEQAKGHYALFDQTLAQLQQALAEPQQVALQARWCMERLALCWQAATLICYGEKMIANTFVSSRFSDHRGSQYGVLASDVDAQAIVNRAMPTL